MATTFENSVRIVRSSRTIEVTKTFDKAASRFGTREYEAMQQVRKDYPDFAIVVKTVRNKADHFKGLTYDFMEKYIASHDDDEKSIMKVFNDLEIKAWFFKTYPEIEAFQKRRESALAA